MKDDQILEQAQTIFCTCDAGQRRRKAIEQRASGWNQWLEETRELQVRRAQAKAQAEALATVNSRWDPPPHYNRRASFAELRLLAADEPNQLGAINAAERLATQGYLMHKDGKSRHSLLLWSTGLGTLKTTTLTAAYLQMTESKQGMWVRYGAMLKAIRAGYHEHKAYDFVRKLETTPVLLIDELGRDEHQGDPTEHTAEMLHHILYERHDWERPTLFTSNYSAQRLCQILGEASFVRLREMAAVLNTDGKDHRGYA